MDTFLTDLRFGIRMLFKHPVLSVSIIVTFGLGIALTTSVFSIVNGVLYKGLPFESSDDIVAVSRTDPERNIQNMGVSVQDYVDWLDQQSVFESIGAYSTSAINLSAEEGRPERFTGGRFTPGVFEVLRVQPAIGRVFREEESRPGANPVIILGFDIWQDRFAGAIDIVGQTVRTNGIQRTVVGVMPEDFLFPNREQLWIPLEIDATASERGEGPQFPVVARLAEGVSVDQASAQMTAIASRLEQAYPESNEGIGANVMTLTERFLGPDLYSFCFTMLGAVFGVLLIGCANITNLLLARASVRTREVAVRTALGAGRRRVILQLLTEVLVLALVGGTIGFGLGHLGLEWFKAVIAIDPPPFWITFEHDHRVVLFVIGTTLIAALFSGIFPALQASATSVGETLKDEGRGSSGMKMGKFSGGLVIAEVAVSCGLLIAAGLMIKSVTQLNSIDLPFTTDNILTARINLPVLEYPDTVSRLQFYDELLPRLDAIPGVSAATLSDGLPASGNGTRVFEVEGQTYEVDEDFPVVREGIVTPGYFSTFETNVLRGRAFTTSDRRETLPVAVVNETFARVFFEEGDALGRRIRMGRRDTTAQWLTVIGVVPDMKMEGVTNNDASPAGFYIPILQSGVGNFVSIAVRTQGPPLAKTQDVRNAVTSIDPNLPIFQVLSMNGVIDRFTWFYSVFGTMFMVFGFAALFLAAVGLYGVMSFAVNRRTQEMGIRMALGAQGAQLVKLIMRKGLIQMFFGLGIGLLLAVLAANPLQIILYEVNARDPFVFSLVIAALALTGVVASLVPAFRITKLDLIAALTPE